MAHVSKVMLKLKTSKLVKRSIVALLTLVMPVLAYAYAFSVENADGKLLYYDYYRTYNLGLCAGPEPYSGVIVVPDSVEYNGSMQRVKFILESAFANATELEGVIISGRTDFHERACINSSLEFVRYDCDNIDLGEFGYFEIERSAFKDCKKLTRIELPNVVTVRDSAFAGCDNLRFVEFPDSCSLGKDSFIDCNNLNTVIFAGRAGSSYSGDRSDTNPIWGDAPVQTLVMTDKFMSESGDIYHLSFDDGVRCFQRGVPDSWSRPYEAYIPSTVKTLEVRYNDKAYVDSYFREYISKDKDSDGYYWTWNGLETLRLKCKILSYISLRSELNTLEICDVEEIANGVLESTTPKKLKLPFAGAGTVDNHDVLRSLFSQKGDVDVPSSLECLELDESATHIIDNALKNCYNIKTLILHDAMRGLGENALFGCSGMENIYVSSTFPPAAYENTFEGMNFFQCIIHVPHGSKKYYEIADGWKRFYNIVEDATIDNPNQINLNVEGTDVEICIDEIINAVRYVLTIFDSLTGNEVYRSSQSSPGARNSQTQISFHPDNLLPNTSYTYRMEAYDSDDNIIFNGQGQFETDNASASIESIESREEIENAEVQYYNLRGSEVDASCLKAGIYIRKQGHRVSKVLIK